jgi:hypothetical protein
MISKTPTPPRALELVRFTLHDAHAEDFLSATESMVDTVRRHFDGLEHFSRARLEDGSYVDLVIWRSMEHARTAAAGVMQIPELAKLFGAIDRVVEMTHGELALARAFAPS